MEQRHVRVTKEAGALVIAVGVVAASVFLGQRSMGAEAVAAHPVRTTVAVVNASDPNAAAAAWSTGPTPSTPTVLVMGPTSAAGCGLQEVPVADAAPAITAMAACSTGDPARVTAVPATLRAAADDARAASSPIVLIGDGWTSAPPVPMTATELSDPAATERVINNAQLAGVIPELAGIPVTFAPTSAVDPAIMRAWERYFAAAGAGSVVWLLPPTAQP